MAEQAAILPEILRSIDTIIRDAADEVTALDQAIGDGDHVFNLQRGLGALLAQADDLAQSGWDAAFKTMGMTLMSTVGGASGSLYATLFLSLAKGLQGRSLDLPAFAQAFATAVDAVRARGKADLGEKTMLDVLIPVSRALLEGAAAALPIGEVLRHTCAAAEAGVEATRNLVATKGRASFLGERSRGHLDAGAKTSQLMVRAVCGVVPAG